MRRLTATPKALAHLLQDITTSALHQDLIRGLSHLRCHGVVLDGQRRMECK